MPNVVCCSPVDVLRKYSATLQELIDPDDIAQKLFSATEKLVSEKLIDDFHSRRDLSRRDKARLILNELILHTMSGGDEIDKFKTLCDILKTDSTYLMRDCVQKLEKEVAVSSVGE